MHLPQLIELVFLAAAAVVVLYSLYAVLGRRIGRLPGQAAPASPGQPELAAPAPAEAPASGDVQLSGLAALKARDSAFDLDKFLQGSRAAFETIVRAFATGDRATLKGLVSAQVLAGFEKAMAEREAQGRTESAEFVHPPRADLESSDVDGDIARMKVRFLAEFRSQAADPAAAAAPSAGAQGRRTAETWTFERNLNSRDPNWTLVRVDAAEA